MAGTRENQGMPLLFLITTTLYSSSGLCTTSRRLKKISSEDDRIYVISTSSAQAKVMTPAARHFLSIYVAANSCMLRYHGPRIPEGNMAVLIGRFLSAVLPMHSRLVVVGLSAAQSCRIHAVPRGLECGHPARTFQRQCTHRDVRAPAYVH